MNKFFLRAAFGVGLLAIGWVAAGYLRSNPLAGVMTGLVGAFYLVGALELRRFDRDTATLGSVLADTPAAVDDLGPWLARVPAPLQNTVRLRVQGDRVALPGPALTPYLAGLLVLLGMLGTFLGMVVTLDGTGAALQRATDLQSMRDSLAAPVKGLGLAFGTSVAGVAASAMLGLMSALCRRDRAQVAQQLDTLVAGPLRVFGRAHQREAALQLQQQQAQLLPALVAQLQALATQLDTQAREQGERLQAGQDRFHGQAETAYRALAASVDQTLQRSLTESARVAAATLQPVVVQTMQGITRETTALHGVVAATVQQQLDGLSARFHDSTQAVTQGWTTALARHESSSEALAQRLAATLDGFGQGFEQRSAHLVDTVAQNHAAFSERLAGTVSDRLEGVGAQLQAAVQGVSATWQDALAHHARTSDGLAQQTQQSQAAAALRFEQQSAALLAALERSHTQLQATLAEREAQRLAAGSEALSALAGGLQREWQQAGAQAVAQQAQICQTLEDTATRIAAQAEAHARSTIGEIGRLVQAASEAPRAAAEVVAQLREKLSDSLVRDNALLEERSQIMATLNTLLGAVQHTSTEQRAAIDKLVLSSAAWMEQAGARFTDKVDAEAARMEAVAAQLTGSAVDVASLGEAFAHAVELFSQSSQQLMGHLQRVDDTLGRQVARSDEQLAYYVAQAREVIDLSLSSQKQIVEDLQRIASQRVALAGAA